MTDRQYIELMRADGLDDALNHRTPKYADEPAYAYGYSRGEDINNGR